MLFASWDEDGGCMEVSLLFLAGEEAAGEGLMMEWVWMG